MKSKLLGLIFLAAIFSAVVSGIYYWEMAHPDISMPLSHILPVANSKTYTNEKYGFEFIYPKDRTVFVGVNAQQESFLPASADSSKFIIADDEKMAFCCESNDLTFEVIASNLSAKEWVRQNFTKYSDQAEIVSVSDTVFAGKPARVLLGAGDISSVYKLIAVKDGKQIIVISQRSQSKLFDEILSTFKFNADASISSPNPAPGPSPSPNPTSSPDTVFCGGIGNIPCPTTGYICEVEGYYPDAGKICRKQMEN